ncbi:MAG: 50S ribosomal protein L9 [Actinomycetota bacterium]|jgi:large subunit ribosomal protein L9|nr:50S ribosomal protein L9 [Actinomycetota bacterium]MDA8279007.1 50S ribosomal protein L9 [Actinomycetota bacterium]
MRVLLRSNVDRLGKRGDIVEVSKGFARNFLFPERRAVDASPGIEAQAAAMRRSRDLREAADHQAAETVARTLTGATLRIEARAGSGGRLFGSVTTADLAAAAEAQAGVVLDRRRIQLEEPIKTVGVHSVPVHLGSGVAAHMTIEVVAAED